MKSTAIECKLIREGGTRVEISGTEYHFQPQTDGAHVALIDDEGHADVLLSITEGYRLYRGEVQPVASEYESLANAGPSQEEKFEAAVASLPAAAPVDEFKFNPAVKPEHDERAELAIEYEALYGEAPHARTGIKRLRELIAAKQTV